MNGRQYHRFRRGLERVEAVQRDYLLKLVTRNCRTEYGRTRGFANIGSVGDYQARVPVTNYEDYVPYIDDIARGRQGVLTQEPVLLFEPSSGTSSASKMIPYTNALKAEFQRAIAPWIVSLYLGRPQVLGGSAYWSISPATRGKRLHGKIPVGFDEDAEYLGFVGRWLYSQVAAVPSEVSRSSTVHDFKVSTLTHLAARKDLAFASVWSPTFLTGLLDYFPPNALEVVSRLERSGLKSARARAAEIRRMLDRYTFPEVFQCLWPRLQTVSCWTHGPSRYFSEKIAQYLPCATVQPKGLISTEAVVSLPFSKRHDPVLAVDSHFFEFLDLENGDIRLGHELDRGNRYSVIVTTGGGFYRYRTHDIVQVTGHINGAPTFQFVSKEDFVSDLFGEKLHLDHVHRSVEQVFASLGLRPGFLLFAPCERKGTGVAYTLFMEVDLPHPHIASKIVEGVNQLLMENFHYAHCVEIGQLQPVEGFLIDRTQKAPEEVFTGEMRRRGMKLGNIKPSIMDREMGWELRFAGRFI